MKPQPPKDPDARYGKRGRRDRDKEFKPFVHRCFCGEWGSFGYGVSLRQGKTGKWFCGKHRPNK